MEVENTIRIQNCIETHCRKQHFNPLKSTCLSLFLNKNIQKWAWLLNVAFLTKGILTRECLHEKKLPTVTMLFIIDIFSAIIALIRTNGTIF